MASAKYSLRVTEPWNTRMRQLLPKTQTTMAQFVNDAIAAHVLELEQALEDAALLREQVRREAAERASTLPDAPGPGPRPGSGAPSLDEIRRRNLKRRETP